MDIKKLVQKVIKYFNRASVYGQLRSSMKFLLPHKKNIVFKLNIGGGSFTDGQLIVIGLPEYMIDKEDREIFSALKAITGHESEHVNSSDFEYTRIYLKEASEYLYQAYGINRNLGVKISDYIENAIEDGRIEKRLVNRMKGYLKHIKYFRGMWWKYQPVSGEDEYNDFVFAICTVATTGLYPKDWDEFYKGSRAEQNIEKIKPLIIKAINASTEKGCCNYCMDILREVGDYIAELIQDQNMLNNLMQMVVERDYNTSEAGQSTAPSGSTVSVHFKPEKNDDDQDQDQDQNQQQGQSGQSSEEQDGQEGQDQQQGGQSGSQSQSSNKEDEKNEDDKGSGASKNEDKDEKSTSSNEENEQSQGGNSGKENEEESEKSSGAGSDNQDKKSNDEKSDDKNGQGKGSDSEDKEDDKKSSGAGSDKNETENENENEEENSNGDENQEKNDQENTNSNSGKGEDEEKADKDDEGNSGSGSGEDNNSKDEENKSNGSSDSQDNKDEEKENQNGESGTGSEDKDKSKEEENSSNGDGKSDENEEADEENQDGLNSKSNSDDQKNDEENNEGNSDDEAKNPNKENDENGENGQGGNDEEDDNIEIEHVPDGKDGSQNEDEKDGSKSEGNNGSDEKQTGSDENQDNAEKGDSQQNANSQNQNSQDSSDKNEQESDQYGENEDNFSDYTTDADIVEQELDKVREEALTESQRALDNAKKEDDMEAKKKQKEEDGSKASSVSPDELDEIAKKYKNDETPLFHSVKFDKEEVKVLPTEIEREAKKLEKEIKAILINKKPFNSKHQRRGVLDTNSLWQFGVKDYNMFQKKGNPNKSNYVFYILEDGSGSMSERVDDYSTKWFYASKASAIIEEAIKQYVPFKVATYTAGYGDNLHYVVKDFNENNKANKCWNFYHYYKPNNGNKDGHSIRVATKELQKRTETNKVLIVLSDGLPSAYRANSFGQADVRDAVREARKNGITVISIAFGSEAHRKSEIDTYKAMYQNGIIACDPAMITNELIKVFKKEFLK